MPLITMIGSRARRVAMAILAVSALVAPSYAATLYAVGGNGGPSGGQTGLYTLDPGTGNMTWVGSPHTAGSYDNTIYNGGLAYDPYTNRLYALGCDSSAASALFLVDPTDASMVRIGYLNVGNPYAFCSGGLAFDVTSQLRNTTGHNLIWDPVFENPDNFKRFVEQQVNAILYIAAKKFL